MLGDRKAQDKVRADTSNVVHCPLLRHDPVACDGCKNNPHEQGPRQERLQAHQEAADIVERALELEELAAVGLLPASLTQLEVIALRMAHKYSEAVKQNEMVSSLARLIIR